MIMSHTPQVSIKPRCPECGSTNCQTCRSQRITLSHEGVDHHASKQYRKCRECGEGFPHVVIGEQVKRKRRKTGDW